MISSGEVSCLITINSIGVGSAMLVYQDECWKYEFRVEYSFTIFLKLCQLTQTTSVTSIEHLLILMTLSSKHF